MEHIHKYTVEVQVMDEWSEKWTGDSFITAMRTVKSVPDDTNIRITINNTGK